MEKEFYSLSDIIDKVGISRISLYRYIKNWSLKSYKFWKNHRIKKSDYEVFIESMEL